MLKLKAPNTKALMRSASGDTLVEVLIAIGIAAFAIGVTYSTAERSLNQSIAARERNYALNIMQDQITDLKLRYQKSASADVFNSSFGTPKNHFCLDSTTTTPGPSPPWTPYFNTGSPNESSPLQINPYNASCRIVNTGASYYIDIQTTDLGGSITQNPTVYQVFVRWERVGGGQVNQASIYYRVNGASGQTLGLVNNSYDTIYALRPNKLSNSHETSTT
jgi:type II secretory pathway pseudopilin PulG